MCCNGLAKTVKNGQRIATGFAYLAAGVLIFLFSCSYESDPQPASCKNPVGMIANDGTFINSTNKRDCEAHGGFKNWFCNQ